MSPYYFTRRTLAFFGLLLIFICAFILFESHQQRSLPETELAEKDTPLNIIPALNQGTPLPDESQMRHLAIVGQHLCVFAGPVEGGGELLQQLDIPLNIIPGRWLAQLTNGGIEFPDEESLYMALDNLDELAN